MVFCIKFMSVTYPDNQRDIDDWISQNPNSLLKKRSRPVTINGKIEHFQGYRLPRELVFYNVQNGRYAATYPQLLKANGGRELDSSNKNDRKKIMNHLLSLYPDKNDRTIASLKQDGQEKLGIITQDGILIDGNRRMACIAECRESTKDTKFDFIEVARLDRPITDSDRYDCEVRVSMGMDSKVDYGPIDKLIKLDKGKKFGKSNLELANLMYGMTEKDVEDQLQVLDKMKSYLRIYYNNDDDFTPLEHRAVHFTEMFDIDSITGFDDLEDEQKEAIEKVSFRLTRGANIEGNDDFASRRLRKIKHAVFAGMGSSLEKLVEIADDMEPYDPAKDEKDESPTKIGFVEFEDKVKAQDNQDKVIMLVNSILANLEFLNTSDPRLKETESKEKIMKIKDYVEKLTSDVGV
jgi:hypothetical protein